MESSDSEDEVDYFSLGTEQKNQLLHQMKSRFISPKTAVIQKLILKQTVLQEDNQEQDENFEEWNLLKQQIQEHPLYSTLQQDVILHLFYFLLMYFKVNSFSQIVGYISMDEEDDKLVRAASSQEQSLLDELMNSYDSIEIDTLLLTLLHQVPKANFSQLFPFALTSTMV